MSNPHGRVWPAWWTGAKARDFAARHWASLGASALRIRHGARAACKRLRGERDEARRERDRHGLKLEELRERFRRVRLPESLLNGRIIDGGSHAQVALVPPAMLDLCAAEPPVMPTIQIATFKRIIEATKINGVDVTWTTWRPVMTESAEQEDER